MRFWPFSAEGKARVLEDAFVRAIERIDVKAGEHFVLTIPGDLRPDHSKRMRAAWESFAGPDAKLLVLINGARLQVVSNAGGTVKEPLP